MATVDPETTARCVSARCGDPADLRCPLCGARLCHACAREHCAASARLCSAAALRPSEVPAPCGRDLMCIEDGRKPDGIWHEARCPLGKE